MVYLGSEAFNFRDVALLITQVSSDGRSSSCLPADRVKYRVWRRQTHLANDVFLLILS